MQQPPEPQPPGFMPQHEDGGAPPVEGLADDENTESFLTNWADPQCGHCSPFQSLDRTRSSLSLLHFLQWNS